jgi:hypothetical protein
MHNVPESGLIYVISYKGRGEGPTRLGSLEKANQWLRVARSFFVAYFKTP